VGPTGAAGARDLVALARPDDPPERLREQFVLLVGAGGHADRPRRAEAGQLADDDALPQQRLGQAGAVAVRDVRVDEVRLGGLGIEAGIAQRALEPNTRSSRMGRCGR
jgi:hypothetical protein